MSKALALATLASCLFLFPALLSGDSAQAVLPSAIQEAVANGCDAGPPPQVSNPYSEIRWGLAAGDYLVYRYYSERAVDPATTYFVIMGYSGDRSSVLVYEYTTFAYPPEENNPSCSWRSYDKVFVDTYPYSRALAPRILPIYADGENLSVTITEDWVQRTGGSIESWHEEGGVTYYSGMNEVQTGGGRVDTDSGPIYIPQGTSSDRISVDHRYGVWTYTRSDIRYDLVDSGNAYVPPIAVAQESIESIEGTYSIGERYSEICFPGVSCLSGVRFITSSGEELLLSVTSPSTVDIFILDEENAALYFEVDGDSEAYLQATEFTIGNVLVGDYIVLVDGNETSDYELRQDPETGETSIVVEHSPGDHEIIVKGVSVVPEFPIALVAAATGIAAMIAVTSRGRLGL